VNEIVDGELLQLVFWYYQIQQVVTKSSIAENMTHGVITKMFNEDIKFSFHSWQCQISTRHIRPTCLLPGHVTNTGL